MPRTRLQANPFPPDALARAHVGKAFIGMSLSNGLWQANDRLHQLFEWVVDHFGQFDLLVGDYLERHNYQAFDGMSEPAATGRAMKEGLVAENSLRSLIGRTSRFGQVNIISAATLSNHPDFSTNLDRLRKQFDEDPAFRSLLEYGIDLYLCRKHRSKRFDPLVRRHCIQYQIEEVAIFQLLVEAGYTLFVYPGAHLPIMKAIAQGTFSGEAHGLNRLNLVELRLFEDAPR